MTVHLTEREHRAEEVHAARLDSEVADAVRLLKTKLDSLPKVSSNKGSEMSRFSLLSDQKHACTCNYGVFFATAGPILIRFQAKLLQILALKGPRVIENWVVVELRELGIVYRLSLIQSLF